MNFRTVITAFQFLTIIPVGRKWHISEKDVGDSPAFFPLPGALQGLVLVLASFLILKVFSPEITAAFALLAYLFTNGGFHQDGLSDTIDAFSVKSSGNKQMDRERRLAVMKDSTIGPMGVIAIVFSLVLKYLLIKEIISMGNLPVGYLVLFLLPVFSKWTMVCAMYRSRSARKDGIGRIMIERMGARQLILSSLLVLILAFAARYSAGFPSLQYTWSQMDFAFFLLSGMVILGLLSMIMRTVFQTRFGGLTGDTFGAIHEVSEIAFLVFSILWIM